MIVLQILAGVVLGLGVVGGVFWITFRRPPPRRRIDSTTSSVPNGDADYGIHHGADDGHGGSF